MGNNASAPSIPEDEKLKKKRELVLEEIIQTEKSYVTYLAAIQEVYIDQLRGQYKSLIKEDNIKACFLTEPLLEFHVQFFTELAICYNSFSWSTDVLPPQSLTRSVTTSQNRLSTTTTTTTTTFASAKQKQKSITSLESIESITSIFNKNTENFKKYSDYIIGYDASVTLLARLRKKKDFENFLVKCRNDSRCNGLDISSLLIMPVQRLPRYILLLNELLKNTPESHPCAKIINKCLKGIKEVAIFVNEAKRDDDNSSKTVILQDLIVEKVNVNESFRKYINDGDFFVHSVYPLKEEDSLLKRLKKYRKAKSKDGMTEQSIFPDEFKASKEMFYYTFNDSLVLLQKVQKSILSFNSKQNLTIQDVSLITKIRVIDVLDIFGFTNCILIFTEKSIYFGQLGKNINKVNFITTLTMVKQELKDEGSSGASSSNNGASSTSDLPSILTLRPTQEKGFFSNLVGSSSSSSSPSPSSNNLANSHKKSQSTTTSTNPPKGNHNKSSPSQSNPPAPRKSMFFK
ncbi:hypothetical protein DICPUDRAFT_81422 [Dictyostelium purpureum]|uniref:DH domain-containing protein n=1 Tax=Dictyostelium purpureum TaxID=5786 RepID=F0ZTF4_DICPU|nr:uncharacterized protein DICPUDRAFT_81422 [Dictyostelium purpureum]EGC32781.1 hypothetical protein DICPUDRAFT_81422 [Dictyostelium purpureum]|eukprot:XP_003290704.1 hypothetical protein DICPUDRAFT_81422 [Dictyostelium purpureum]